MKSTIVEVAMAFVLCVCGAILHVNDVRQDNVGTTTVIPFFFLAPNSGEHSCHVKDQQTKI